MAVSSSWVLVWHTIGMKVYLNSKISSKLSGLIDIFRNIQKEIFIHFFFWAFYEKRH